MADDFEVVPLYDASDEYCEFFVKGHVDREAFLAQVVENWARLGPFLLEDVQHVWRHATPDPFGDKRCIYHSSEPGVRGAFRATVVDAWAGLARRRAAPSPDAKGAKGDRT
jgi:hypothetical protein